MTPKGPKWTRQPDRRPQQIIAAALDVFALKGFRRATMDAVARAAGVTKGTIYLYFSSKEDLFIQTLRVHVEQVADLLPAFQLEGEIPADDSARMVTRKLLDALMTPNMAKAMPLFVAEVKHIPALRKAYVEEWLPQVNFRLAEVFSRGMEAGLIKQLDPVITARAIIGMFSEFILTQQVFELKDITPMELDAIADTIVTIAFHGVLAAR
ncbi:MAG TPA: TetR/AcrR family transcriptional regulator [Candidatus Hydrogenedentes bacterium]|nr:TetR/AcrR family transcriptional regulator [Candidatus Hydrogenedentota bacterium]